MCTFQHTLILEMLYANAFLILNVLIFFIIKERGFYSFSSNWFLKYTGASLFSAQIFSIFSDFHQFLYRYVGSLPPSFPPLPILLQLQTSSRDRNWKGQIYIHWVAVLTFQYKIAWLLYCFKVRVLPWKGCFIDIELITQTRCNGS